MKNKTEDEKLLYKQWYFQELGPNLTITQKLDILKRISELNHENAGTPEHKMDYREHFPEITIHSKDEMISRLHLQIIKEAILEELHFPA